MAEIQKSGQNKMIPVACTIVAAGFAAVLCIPASREIFKQLSGTHPYIMGFIKFGLLATLGELLAIRLSAKKWEWPQMVAVRMLIWGLIGIAITYMMKCFSGGISFLLENGYLPGNELVNNGSMAGRILRAFYISATMNLSFGPTFMAFHKCTDKWIELHSQGQKNIGAGRIVGDVDWSRFVTFTLFKTIPLFWIPAHTLTFMLPAEYQVFVAATLSIALGIILSLKK